MSVPSALSASLALLKSDLQIDFIPVLIGALQALQKSPGALGIAAAEAYLLGNAPAALLAAETSVIQTGIADLNARLTALETAGQAAVKPA